MKHFAVEQTSAVGDGRRFANAHQFVGWIVTVANWRTQFANRNGRPWYGTIQNYLLNINFISTICYTVLNEINNYVRRSRFGPSVPPYTS